MTLLVGTLYCAAYCRIAYVPMHEGRMPLWLSAWWAATALLPWLLAFEILKRAVPIVQSRQGKIVLLACLCVVTSALTFAAAHSIKMDVSGMMHADWQTTAANQLQPVLIFMILSGLWAAESRHSVEPLCEARFDVHGLPPLHRIDWIRAAGNYVELRCGDRLMIRRMTMRAAEAATAGADFLRVHRSVIVRKSLIDGFAKGDRRRIQLRTGESLPVGDSYRTAIERIVPSSRGFSTSAHSTSLTAHR